MKTLGSITILFLGVLLIGCSASKAPISTEEKAKLDELVQSEALHLEARWANPLSTRSMNSIATSGLLPPGTSPNRIDIIGTTSYLKMEKDSVFAILPYYGERQFGSTYNPADVGIRFKGVPENYEMAYNEKKQQYEFQFDVINDQGEGFNVNGTLFPNFRTIFYINSTERMTIGYSGTFDAIETE